MQGIGFFKQEFNPLVPTSNLLKQNPNRVSATKQPFKSTRSGLLDGRPSKNTGFSALKLLTLLAVIQRASGKLADSSNNCDSYCDILTGSLAWRSNEVNSNYGFELMDTKGDFCDHGSPLGQICPEGLSMIFNSTTEAIEGKNTTRGESLSSYDITCGPSPRCELSYMPDSTGLTPWTTLTSLHGGVCRGEETAQLGEGALIFEASNRTSINLPFSISKQISAGTEIIIFGTDHCVKGGYSFIDTVPTFPAKTTTDFQNAIKDVNPVSPKELVAVKLEDLAPYTKQFVLNSDGSKRLESYDRLETTVTVNREPINSYTKLSELIRINSTTFYMNVADKRNGEFQYSQALTLTMGNFSKEITTHYPTLKNCIVVNQQIDSQDLLLRSNEGDSSINFGDILVEKAEIYYSQETYELDKLSKPNTFSLDQQILVVEGLNQDVDLKIYNINGETLNENGEIQAGAFIELGQTNSDESVNELFELTLVNLLIAGSSILGLFLFTCLCMKCCMKANETDIQELKNKQSRLEESVGLLDTKLATEERIADSISKQVVRSLPQTPDRRETSAPIYTAVLVEDGTNPPVIPFGVDGPSRPIYNV